MKTIIFDSKSAMWYYDWEYSMMFIKMQIQHLKDTCKYRGYLYLNEVYESFGVAWDPDEENICYKQASGGITFDVEPSGDKTYLIHIS